MALGRKKRVLLVGIILLCCLYLGDYLQIRYRVWRNHDPYGTVTVQILYAISEKGSPGTNKTEYASGDVQDWTCVQALFPHFGYSPCWYLRRRPTKTVSI